MSFWRSATAYQRRFELRRSPNDPPTLAEACLLPSATDVVTSDGWSSACSAT